MAAFGLSGSTSEDRLQHARLAGLLTNSVALPSGWKDVSPLLCLPTVSSLADIDNAGMTYSVTQYPFEEDTTLYFSPPSLADLTACVSSPIVGLSKSFSKMNTALPLSLSTVELASRQSFRISRSVGSEILSRSSYQVRPAPSIPSIVSSMVNSACLLSGSFGNSSIDSYHIIGPLGSGTYGEVVLASSKDQADGSLYAIKILHETEESDVARELSTLKLVYQTSRSSSVNQGNVGVAFLQQLREAFQNEDCVHYLVLEYHPCSLADAEVASRFRLTNDPHVGLSPSISLPVTSTCRSGSARSQDEIVQSVRLLAAEISLGLDFLHKRGLVHQDIKPANILLSSSGHVVIGDFGATSKMPFISCERTALACGARTDQYGPIVLRSDDTVTFTPLYAAPELKERTFEGMVVYDNRSDWWSLGVLLYEMITGTVPFLAISGPSYAFGGRRSDGDPSLAFGELEALSDRLKDRNNIWYPGVENFLRSLMSHNPDDRLSWPDIKDHQFLDPLQDLWEDIAALKYPPCPNPPVSHVNHELGHVLEATEEIIVDTSLNLGPSPEDEWVEHEFSFGGLFNSSLSITPVKTWEPPSLVHDQPSDDSSVLEALPSSASIWTFEHPLDAGVDGPLSSTPSAMSDTFRSSQKHSANVQPLRSPFVPTPAVHTPQLKFDLRTDSLLTSKQPQELVYNNFITAEDLTWSLIEAMDQRDRHLHEKHRQRIYRENRKTSQNALRRILGRLFVQ